MPTNTPLHLAIPGTLAAYESYNPDAINAVYVDTAGLVTQIARKMDGTFQLLELAQQLKAPPVQQSVSAYMSAVIHSPVIDYADIYGYIEEFTNTAGSWAVTNQSQQMVGYTPSSRGVGLTSFDVSTYARSIVYIDIYGHIQLLSLNPLLSEVLNIDLTKVTGAPLPDLYHYTAIAGMWGQVSGTQEIFYRDQNQHIARIFSSQGDTWLFEDITAKTNTPLPGGGTFSVLNAPTFAQEMVVYMDTQGHIQQLSMSQAGSWNAADLTQITQAPPALGITMSAYTAAQGTQLCVVYADQQRHIQQLTYNGSQPNSWGHAIDLLAQNKAQPLTTTFPTLVAVNSSQSNVSAILYIDEAQHVDGLFETTNGWQFIDLTSHA